MSVTEDSDRRNSRLDNAAVLGRIEGVSGQL